MMSKGEDTLGLSCLPFLESSGYDYAELPLAQCMALDDTAFEAVCADIGKAGIPCRSCNNFFPAQVRLTGGEVSKAAVEVYIRKALARAARLGAHIIVFGSSGAKNVPEGFDRETAFAQIADTLRLAAMVAEPLGIIIVVEPLNRSECNIINTLDEGIRLVQAADHPNAQLLVDYYHFTHEGETLDALRRAAPFIRHVHYAQETKRTFPNASQAKEIAFFQLMKDMGYRGDVSIEANTGNPAEDIPRFVQVFGPILR